MNLEIDKVNKSKALSGRLVKLTSAGADKCERQGKKQGSKC